ncbi:MAG TPA: hypothetical protein VMR95_01990 [Candidatus Binatia bacterium]|nr:hypothetical protein [Candidatus Binatia bacterium]
MPEKRPEESPPMSVTERFSDFLEEPRGLARYGVVAAFAAGTRVTSEDLGLDSFYSIALGTGVGVLAIIGTGVLIRRHENRKSQSDSGQQTEI